MSMAQIVDSTIVTVGLPRTGRLTSGLAVSGYHLLDAAILEAEGWVEVADPGEPDYDPATHQVTSTVELVDGVPTRVYQLVEVEVDVELAGEHADPQIGALDA